MANPPTSVPPALPELARLREVIAALRTPGSGCPWDLAQTAATLAPHLVEETYETVEAIERADDAAVREELGDVLMNVLLLARLHEETGAFDVEDVARTVADKLVRRHPHVFGGAPRESSPARTLATWEAIKRSETAAPRSVLGGVPRALPALLAALRVGEKAARVGFDWPDASGATAKLAEELAEFTAACATGDEEAAAAELGDVLFSLVNVARHRRIDPEAALRSTIGRFKRRFAFVERRLGDRLASASLAEMEAAWQEAKAAEATGPA